ncbi:MAG: AAA family ATPase [Cyanobacteria bacterium SBLK]|nr:AAA family ATPase [Cyanobacteria bacterium SBLK]
MARPSYGPRTRQRAQYFLECLLAFADDEFEAEGMLKIHCNKQDPTRLIFQTKMRYLERLTAIRDGRQKLTAVQIKEAIARMNDFLGILEDNRVRTQGSDRWHFTLTLWHPYREKEANLHRFNREWESKRPEKSKQVTGELISAANPLAIEALNSEEETTPPTALEFPYHNLPARDRAAFIGRDEEFNRLLTFLAADNPIHRISIEGMAGMGKTTLMLEVAYLCLDARDNPRSGNFPHFEAIIFSSAKSHRLHAGRLLPRFQRERDLGDIFRAIANTLGCKEILGNHFAQQYQQLREYLANQPTLLLLDNADTFEDPERILAFLYELPNTVKVLLTTRVQMQLDAAIRLESLPEKQALELMEAQGKLKQISLDPFALQPLYPKTEGNPLAIVYTIAQLASGYPLEAIAARLREPSGEIARFCLESSVEPLRGELGHRLFMAIALFAAPPIKEAIAVVADIEDALKLAESLARLQQLSLLKLEEGRYKMRWLAKEYAIAELADNPQFATEARSRWLAWYLNFSVSEDKPHWREWRDYSKLEADWENTRAAFEWCLAEECYPEAKVFWQQIKGYSYIYGYWNERLNWLAELLPIARQHGDRAMEIEILSDRAWTLMLRKKDVKLAEVEEIFAELAERVDEIDSRDRLELLHSRAILAFEQEEFDSALQWLAEEKQLLAQIKGDRETDERQWIRIQYYEAGIYCKMEDFPRAKEHYQQALARAREIQWQQVEVYILNWLAEIAVMTRDLERAEDLLEQSWPIAQLQKDRRSIAFHKRTRARLERFRDRMDASQKTAWEALADFEALGMRSEAAELKNWLAKHFDRSL